MLCALCGECLEKASSSERQAHYDHHFSKEKSGMLQEVMSINFVFWKVGSQVPRPPPKNLRPKTRFSR